MNEDICKRLFAKIDSYKKEMVDCACALVAMPAMSPKAGGEGEGKKAAYLEKLLATWGIDDVEHCDAPDEGAHGGKRPNLVVRLKGRDSARRLWVVSHLDVVPPGDLTQWGTDPFQAAVKDGKIFGRGTEDNGQALVASIFAFRALKELGVTPAVDVCLMLSSDEETGSEKGVIYAMEKGIFKKGDTFIVPDAGNEDGTLIEVSEKSILWLKFTTEGRQCHGSLPDRGNNALRAGMKLALEIDRALHAEFGQTNKLFEPPNSTFEPTKKEANVPNINTIPGHDVFYMDCRILPEIDPEQIDRVIAETIAKVAKETKATFRVEKVQFGRAAPPTSPDAPIVKTVAAAVRAVHPIEPYAGGIGGGTFATPFRRAGYDAVVYSKIDDTCHGPNEYAIIENMIGDAKVLAAAMASFA